MGFVPLQGSLPRRDRFPDRVSAPPRRLRSERRLPVARVRRPSRHGSVPHPGRARAGHPPKRGRGRRRASAPPERHTVLTTWTPRALADQRSGAWNALHRQDAPEGADPPVRLVIGTRRRRSLPKQLVERACRVPDPAGIPPRVHRGASFLGRPEPDRSQEAGVAAVGLPRRDRCLRSLSGAEVAMGDARPSRLGFAAGIADLHGVSDVKERFERARRLFSVGSPVVRLP
jgi:hypothetical protein